MRTNLSSGNHRWIGGANRCSGHKPPPIGQSAQSVKATIREENLVKMKMRSPEWGSQATKCFHFPSQETVPEEATSSWEILKHLSRPPTSINQETHLPGRKEFHPSLSLPWILLGEKRVKRKACLARPLLGNCPEVKSPHLLGCEGGISVPQATDN